jgi:chorismate mutase|tara:strand:+ start:202 stop:483 length:282 start_codon:yes stop_codon:yes gene_type:complete
MNKLNIKAIRKKLDKLDDNLLVLIKKRTTLVNEVINIKKFKNQIVDKKRIQLILKRIKKKSITMKIDKDITNKIWKTMIRAFISYEFKNFDKK